MALIFLDEDSKCNTMQKDASPPEKINDFGKFARVATFCEVLCWHREVTLGLLTTSVEQLMKFVLIMSDKL